MRTIGGFIVAPTVQDQKLKALAAREFQTTLLGMMGHDLRQSLHVIQGTYSLLRSRLEELPQQAWLDGGERAVTKLTEQLNCLVDAFYLAERANALEVSSVGLGPLFWRLRHENEDAAIQRSIDLRAVTTNAHVVSNPVLLGCILRNLLTNAIKYTEPGGRIGCRCKGPEIRVDVYDTGIGIPGTPAASNLRVVHAPCARAQRRFGHWALHCPSRAGGAWPPDRSPIDCGGRVAFLDLRARCSAKHKLTRRHNLDFWDAHRE
jgi:two-component system, OmpR family, phosphate regulon sensor histidine kinase PhoR